MSIFTRWWRALDLEKQREREQRRAAAAMRPPVILSVKQRFREQFEKGLAIARQKRTEGMRLEELAQFLNEQGWLTRTGRKWTPGILHQSLRRPWDGRNVENSLSNSSTKAAPNPGDRSS
jgi:hypothetical protein